MTDAQYIITRWYDKDNEVNFKIQTEGKLPEKFKEDLVKLVNKYTKNESSSKTLRKSAQG